MCMYCVNIENEHFECVNCDEGMCDECYDSGNEHTECMFDFHESIEDDKLYNYIKNKTGFNYGYLCFNCNNILEKELKNGNNNNGYLS